MNRVEAQIIIRILENHRAGMSPLRIAFYLIANGVPDLANKDLGGVDHKGHPLPGCRYPQR